MTSEGASAGPNEPERGAAQTPNREAAARRRQLREVEAERDGLREQVTAMQRAEVERAAERWLADPADLWLAGVELSALVADDGSLDPALVSAAVQRVAAEKPHWSKPAPNFDAGVRVEPGQHAPSFGRTLKHTPT